MGSRILFIGAVELEYLSFQVGWTMCFAYVNGCDSHNLSADTSIVDNSCETSSEFV